ncbi:hypothetical protein [Enterocloster bolteae]|uniref:hypothetical protein n=1 Tax=Enterocloster bolteae TaxID=208479 RepID=UPI002A81E1D7|nr:hypothetical protein [Enterocloster bolteae]
MIEEAIKKLTMDSDTFEDLKRDMTFVLQRLLGNMLEKGSDEGSITMKMDISLTSESVPNCDPTGKEKFRTIQKPKFAHKISSVMKITDEKKGNLNTEMELVFDEEVGEYYMRPVINTTQRSLFDDDYMNAPGGEEVNPNIVDGEFVEQPTLAGEKYLAIIGPCDGDDREEDENFGDPGEDNDEEPDDEDVPGDFFSEDKEDIPFNDDDDFGYEEPED